MGGDSPLSVVTTPPLGGGSFGRLSVPKGMTFCFDAISSTFYQDGDTTVWTKDGEVISSGNLKRLEIDTASISDGGMYQAHIYRGSDLVYSETSVLLTVFEYGSPANVSSRHFVDDRQDAVAITGFVITNGERWTPILVRAISDSLTDHGVKNPATLSSVGIYNSEGQLVNELRRNKEVLPHIRDSLIEREAALGAFPSGDEDYVGIANLNNGAYTLLAHPADGTNGTVLLELYFELE